ASRRCSSAERRASCSIAWAIASAATSTSSTRPSSSNPPVTPRARRTLIAEERAPLGTVTENYLKAIYAYTEWQAEPMSSSQLAARLGLAPSSVTEMVKKLGRQGLVEHVRYGSVRLTDAGRAEAIRMVRRHRLIETWLVQEFG